jgi:hypothetical protein
MRMEKTSSLGATLLAGAMGTFALLLAPPVVPQAQAQAQASGYADVPDHLQVDAGFFRINANTVLQYDPGSGTTSDVDFERDLGLSPNADTAWIEGTWRVGRRHQVKLSYTWQSRSTDDFTLARDIDWGGAVYQAGLTASSKNSSKLLGGYYRFAVYRNDRFEIGPAIGIGYIWLDAQIRGTASISGPGASPTVPIDRTASTGSITGAVGGYTSAWLLPRLDVQGDFLYIKISTDTSNASVTDWRASAYYYFFRNAGLGVQYKYNRLSYDRGLLSRQLGGEVTYKGVQLLASVRF